MSDKPEDRDHENNARGNNVPKNAASETNIPLDDGSFFSNVFSYMGFPLSRDLGDDSIDTVVMGIPYDLATSGRAGARGGPQGIRQASANLKWEEKRWPWTFSILDRINAIDYGDVQFMVGDSDDMLATVETTASDIISAGKTLLSFGGDHFVTLPLLRAHAKVHGTLALIHFDAHTDTYCEDQRYSHGSMFYHAPQENLIDPSQSIQVGIRTEYSVANHVFEVLDGAKVNEQPVAETVAAIKARVGNHPAYLSFDIDVLDPAYAPGTGTPVVGGLTTSRALQILQGIADLNIVGFDMVEVSPPFDHADITSLAGASIALQFLYMHAFKK